ncbi:MAG: response regulator [Balneolales bacterium]
MSFKNLLYVEDDPYNQNLIRLFLKKEPFHLITADSAAVALDILKKQSIDIIIVDLTLQKEGDGADLIRCIRDLDGYHSVPLFVFSGYDENHFNTLDIANMVQCFFQKPTAKQTLIKALKEV